MDDDVLPQRWSTWFASACEEEGRMQRLGYRSVRAYIEPVSFSLWCQRRSIERYDRDARLAYASDYAARIVVN